MTELFIKLYRFLSKKKWLMYSLLIASTIVFAYFGMKVQYEENIAKLLPQTDTSSDNSLAFENIKVKDKIFLQILPKNGSGEPEEMACLCDAFTENLLGNDCETGYIDNILYKIDDDLMVMGLDYVLEHIPSFVDESCYPIFDSLLTDEAIARQMAENYEILMNDEEGTLSTMICQDPAALRKAVLGTFKIQDNNAGGGFSIIDGHFFSPDSSAVLAFVAPDFNSMDSKKGNGLIALIESEIETFEQEHPDMEVLFHGAPVQSVFNARQIKKDLFLTIGISLLIICIVLGICFKNRSTIFQILSPVAYGALFALACMWWIKGTMSLMALGIGAIVLGVALSYSLHVVTHYKYVSDPEIILRDEAVPVMLGCITTIGAFMGLMFTSSDLLKDFGLFASFAMVGTVVFALVFLPHFFKPERNKKSEKAFLMLDKINSYPLDKVGWLKWTIVIITIVCIFTAHKVQFDSDLRNIGYNNPKALRSQQLYNEKVNDGYTSVYYAAVGDEMNQALEGSTDIDHVMDSLEKEGILIQHSDLSALLVSRQEQEKRIGLWKEYWNEERIAGMRKDINESAEAYGLNTAIFEPCYTMLEADYETSELLTAGILPESLASNFTEETLGKTMIFTSAKMLPEHKSAVSNAVTSVPHAIVIDPFYYTSDMVQVLNDDFNVVLGISSIFVFIVLLFAFKNVLIALVAFMPMALSWYIVKGMMWMFGLEFNLINIVIATFIFGIGVDYSIFVMNGLIAGAKGKGDNLLAYHKTAIFFSAFVLIVVVGSLFFATHPAISSIGMTTLIGMSATVLLTYTLQPALFRLLMKSKKFSKIISK